MKPYTPNINQYKFLPVLMAVFVTLSILTIVLLYKIISFDRWIISAATFIVPFWYTLSDLIAEVYGYKVARKALWTLFLCNFIFIFVIYLTIHLPSPYDSSKQAYAYHLLFDPIPRVFVASFLAVLIGAFLNVYLLTKWKVLIKGRYFWLRSIGSSAIGEAIFTIITFGIEFTGQALLHDIMELMIVSYIVKIVFLPIAATPSAFMAKVLKRYEGVDVYDNNTNFNPLKFLD